MASTFTDEELKELNLSRELADQWQAVMNELWKHSVLYYENPRQGENEILIDDFRLGIYMINNSRLELKIEKQTHTLLMVRFDNNMLTLIKCMDAVLGGGDR